MSLLAKERAAAARRRDEALARQRARRVLSGRWNLRPKQIPPTVAEMYPDLSPEERGVLARMVRTVQREESPRHLPVGSVPVHPIEVERKGEWGTERDRERWRRIFARSMENRPQVRREREVEG